MTVVVVEAVQYLANIRFPKTSIGIRSPSPKNKHNMRIPTTYESEPTKNRSNPKGVMTDFFASLISTTNKNALLTNGKAARAALSSSLSAALSVYQGLAKEAARLSTSFKGFLAEHAHEQSLTINGQAVSSVTVLLAPGAAVLCKIYFDLQESLAVHAAEKPTNEVLNEILSQELPPLAKVPLRN